MSHFVLYSCKNFTTKALAAAALGLDWSDIMIMLCEVILWLCYSYVVAAATAAVLHRFHLSDPSACNVQIMKTTGVCVFLFIQSLTQEYHVQDRLS